MMNEQLVLRNGEQTITFARQGQGYRPEWFRLGERPMLRFKDHEWLNISGQRVTEGELIEECESWLVFGGQEDHGGTPVAWMVRVALPPDGTSGFLVTTDLVLLNEPIEVYEAMTSYELPYEYDGSESIMTVLAQQPVYRYEEGQPLSGAGYMHPWWYYNYMRGGVAHLTYPSASPLCANRVVNTDGSNERCTMLLGNWNATSVKDMFVRPTRPLRDDPADVVFPDRQLQMTPGKRGLKFLIGTVNWNNSLNKDPNVLVEAGAGLNQEVLVDFRHALPDGQWDGWLAGGWERLAQIHFPEDGAVPAYAVATSRGASWTEAAQWLADAFNKPEGQPGFFNPEKGPYVYSPETRPKWDTGVSSFSGQWTGPLAYLGYVYKDEQFLRAAERNEAIFMQGNDPTRHAESVWTIGPTPNYAAAMRKAKVVGVQPALLEAIRTYVTRRTEVVLNPPAGGKRGDAGILAWDAFSNLLAADLFDDAARDAAAKVLLERINGKLDSDFWTFNCAVEGDLVGAGQSRPFGHGIAIAANMLAWQRLGDDQYLQAAQRFGNLLLSMHYITYNESPTPDLDTRGWCLGSTGGRDQWAQLPPWETGYAIQQFAPLLTAGQGRPGYYDALWYYARTGLAAFPKARIFKRIYRPDMSITFQPMDAMPTERAYYLSLPYVSYENPWDQTMLASYQSVEPLILSLFIGGGLLQAEDTRVAALVPQAATFDKAVAEGYTVELWNPLDEPVSTRLYATQAVRRGVPLQVEGIGTATPVQPYTEAVTVPPREVLRLKVTVG